MKQPVLTKKRLPLLFVLICCIELSIYLWSVWTSTLDLNHFFAIQSEFIFDKCARLAGRISSFLILIALFMVGYYGLRKIYDDDRKKETFLILIILFTANHLIHLLFVILRFRSHGKSIIINEPIEIGGTIHGIITFASIIIIPFILWNYKDLSKFIYFVVILHLLNVSSFIIKTFLSKVKPPEHPAYHNQLGILLFSVACIYILFRVYVEHNRIKSHNNLD